MAYTFTGKTTEIRHNQIGQAIDVFNCRDKMCYNLTLDYSMSKSHMNSIIDNSASCYQEIIFKCVISRISGVASWSDRFGMNHKYFTGNWSNVCECHKSNTCYKSSFAFQCNCDQGDPVPRQDTIRIQDKKFLPMTVFHYGGMYSFDQQASVSIGPVVCKGLNNTFDVQSRVLSEVSRLWPNITNKIDSRIKTRKERNNQESFLVFVAIRNTEDALTTGEGLTFDQSLVNYKDCFNKSAGTFTATKEGFYEFSFSSSTFNRTIIGVFKNSSPVFSIHGEHGVANQEHLHLGATFVIHLNSADKVNLKIKSGGIWNNGTHTVFQGKYLGF